jgi:hypothetical protein
LWKNFSLDNLVPGGTIHSVLQQGDGVCANSKGFMIIQRNAKRIFWGIIFIVLLLAGVQIFWAQIGLEPPDLIINEVQFVNGIGLTDEDGDLSDWIELYNQSSQPVNLGGWFLTDDPNQPEKWPLPDRVLGAREYLLVFASGKDRAGETLHANFKLNRNGDFLGLYNVFEKRFMDEISAPLPPQFSDMAYGRFGNELQFGYLGNPTPDAPNDETVTWAGVTTPVEFGVARGFYDEPFLLTLNTEMFDAVIRYTTNGVTPTPDRGQIYSGPIPIKQTGVVRAVAYKPNYLPSDVNTHTYIFLDNVLAQPELPPGFPDAWGVHEIDFAGYRQGEPVQADYEMDPNIVNDPRYRSTIKDDLQSIPVLSLVTEPQNFSMYANPRERGRDWERPVSLEFFDPSGNQPGFQINAGARIQGGSGRWEFMPKHSFQFFFRDEYGPTRLNYPLFPDSAVDEFDTLVLRAGTQRSFAGHPETPDLSQTTYTRDEWLRESQIEISGVGVHGIFVHLYLNGLYWGLYNLLERPNEDWASSYRGGSAGSWYVVNQRGSVGGSDDRFKKLLDLFEHGGLDDPERYAAVQTYLDVPQFIDYMILNWYAGTRDWPESNWYANIQNPDGQLRFVAWDAEGSWVDGAKVHLGRDDLVGLTNFGKIFFEPLVQNPDFKMALADRMYRLLFNNGPLTDANAQARWLRINNSIDRAIVGESARWGDARQEPPLTRDDWLKARDNVLAQMEGNAARLIAQARQLGYYPPLDPPAFNRHGGVIVGGFELSMAAPEGVIYYTTDNTDPRQPVTGEIAPTSQTYQTPLVLTETTRIKARVWLDNPAGDGPIWSALHEANFRVADVEPKLVISEIMYNPLGGNKYEFVELHNVGEAELWLGTMGFNQGIDFAFPSGFPPLAPGKFAVLARDPASFAERYPDVPVAGVYRGKLSNNGETITLSDSNGNIIVSVPYDDEEGWPISADGRGDSLVLVNLTGDPNDPQSWRASTNIYGSPGGSPP